MKNVKIIGSVFHFCLLGLFLTLTMAQCTDPEPVENTGQINMEMTDGPIDDAEVQGAFVTVAAVKIDGETYSGFSGKQTIDLLAFQNGNTKALGLGELEAGTYSNISLVLDYETDANGNAPGCYILRTDNTKDEISSSANGTQEFDLSGAFTIAKDQRTDIVMDFDLRKAIKYDQNSSNQKDFSFVTDSEIQSAIRVVNKKEAGNVKGEMNESSDNTTKVVVFAYKKGTYNRDQEVQGQGASNVQFKNAVTSAVVDAQGNYQLSFLEEGDYEIQCAKYEDTDHDGEFELKGTLVMNGLLNVDLNSIRVSAETNITVNINVTGLLP